MGPVQSPGSLGPAMPFADRIVLLSVFILDTFYFMFFSNYLARNSSVMLNRSGDSRYSYLIPIKGTIFKLFPLVMMLPEGFS